MIVPKEPFPRPFSERIAELEALLGMTPSGRCDERYYWELCDIFHARRERLQNASCDDDDERECSMSHYDDEEDEEEDYER